MKKIKDSSGFSINWNHKRKGDNIIFFVRYKSILPSTPKNPIDLARFLVNQIKKIEKSK